ncbi:MAG: DUF5050 domain-containing protein [Ruminococcaceae bacterium]|nr:DUF5050 domain-containing protein [Oscillospiraceae bacterium]
MNKLVIIMMMGVILMLLLLLPACWDTEEKANGTESGNGPVTEGGTENTHVHAYGAWTTVSEATCEANGIRERTCSCGVRETEHVAVIAHDYVNGVCRMCKKSDPNAFVPDYATGQANTVGSNHALSQITRQDTYLYFTDDRNRICKMKTDYTEKQTVYRVTAGTVFDINVVGDWIYFYCRGATVSKSYIAKVRTDGSGFEKLVSSVPVGEMLVAKDTVYYTTYPIDETYTNYAKEVFPLYSVSVNGGTPKQLYDGAVSDLVADATYLYFTHRERDDDQTEIVRIKHGSTKSSVLLRGKDTYLLSQASSRVYFFVYDPYEDGYVLASVASGGGSYTEYGNGSAMQNTDRLHIIGNKAYYMGGLMFGQRAGLLEHDLATKTAKVVREDYENTGFETANDLMIFLNYNYDAEKLESFTIYDAKTNAVKQIILS